MLFFLALTLLSIATIGSVMVYQRNTAAALKGRAKRPLLPEAEEAPAKERTFETLVPGDVVIEGSADWLIVATATYREEQDTWWLHALDSGTDRRYLEVRQLDGLHVSFLQPAPDVPTFGELFSGLTYRGQPYRLKRRGDARVTVDGDMAEVCQEGLMKYATYLGPGDAVLHIEERGSERSAFAGERAIQSTLTLMPGQRPIDPDPLFGPDDA